MEVRDKRLRAREVCRGRLLPFRRGGSRRGWRSAVPSAYLTAQLSGHCGTLLAVDLAPIALAQARERCADRSNVTFEQMRVPAEWPVGPFDLILLSEIVYFLDRNDVAALAARVGETSRAGAAIVLVHWLGLTNYPLTGDEAADLFIQKSGGFAAVSHQSRTADYRLDVLQAGSACTSLRRDTIFSALRICGGSWRG